jgi:hypothetical protein
VYARKVGDKTYTFGVSGLLYRSNVLMYDHQTESLWLQVKRRAVTGPMTGTKLSILPSTITSWKKWKKKNPETTVLSFKTGYSRNYDRDPYESYYRNRRGMFRSFFKAGPGEEEKEIVAGVEVGDSAKAYPVSVIRQRKKMTDTIGGKSVTFSYDDTTDRISVKTASGEEIEPILVYWFVWKGIHADSGLYRPGK